MYPTIKLIISAAGLLLLLGCASYTYKRDTAWNSHRLEDDVSDDYIYEQIAYSDSFWRSDGAPAGTSLDKEHLHLVLALSGVGSKGGAFSFGILDALRGVTSKHDNRPLLHEVDVISAVSGTSGFAMSYGLYGDKIFEKESEQYALVKHPLRWDASTLSFFNDAVGVSTLLNLPFSKYSFTDAVADHLSEFTYGGPAFGAQGATFEDLMIKTRERGGKPFVIISATDIVKGRRFEFSQPQFDLLCSDLSKLQIGRAVAAASMPPIITSGVRLRNFGARHCPGYVADEIARIEKAQKTGIGVRPSFDPYLTLKTKVSSGTNGYVHLADGALADNLALGPVVAGLERWGTAWSLRRLLNRRPPKKILIIVASMSTRLPAADDLDVDGPGALDQIFPILSIVASTWSIDALEYSELKLRSAIRLLEDSGKLGRGEIELYDSVLVSSSSLSDPKDRECLETFRVQIRTINEDMEDIALLAKKVLYGNAQFRSFAEKNDWLVPDVNELDLQESYQGQCSRD